jgi:hypothetical protein
MTLNLLPVRSVGASSKKYLKCRKKQVSVTTAQFAPATFCLNVNTAGMSFGLSLIQGNTVVVRAVAKAELAKRPVIGKAERVLSMNATIAVILSKLMSATLAWTIITVMKTV